MTPEEEREELGRSLMRVTNHEHDWKPDPTRHAYTCQCGASITDFDIQSEPASLTEILRRGREKLRKDMRGGS